MGKRKKFDEPARQRYVMFPDALWEWMQSRAPYNGSTTDICVRAVQEMRDKIERTHKVAGCKHGMVKQRGDSVECSSCGRGLGWWCPSSPNHQCDYSDGNMDHCNHCGQPDERK